MSEYYQAKIVVVLEELKKTIYHKRKCFNCYEEDIGDLVIVTHKHELTTFQIYLCHDCALDLPGYQDFIQPILGTMED